MNFDNISTDVIYIYPKNRCKNTFVQYLSVYQIFENWVDCWQFFGQQIFNIRVSKIGFLSNTEIMCNKNEIPDTPEFSRLKYFLEPFESTEKGEI